MIHHKTNDRPRKMASADWFTGTVWMDPIIEAPEPARVRAARVLFETGARTNWHTHPLGQTLYVVAGEGRFQTEGQPVQIIRQGDTIWIPPGEKHWHGASPTGAMSHIAIHEALDGQAYRVDGTGQRRGFRVRTGIIASGPSIGASASSCYASSSGAFRERGHVQSCCSDRTISENEGR